MFGAWFQHVTNLVACVYLPLTTKKFPFSGFVFTTSQEARTNRVEALSTSTKEDGILLEFETVDGNSASVYGKVYSMPVIYCLYSSRSLEKGKLRARCAGAMEYVYAFDSSQHK